ncbi:MAG: Transcriptional regulator, TrmB [Candidatus Moranbacteria bacterium GW2011_GWE2_35_2-]|nr:MAG: Transcriptional regulator, TrmB [Candidatus Moranbacteria bacterium GW2011_GWE2_35_2-]KKQ04857.1 MAG: Transcriptional regulator, TrmB [Candidatus Moranbacteria bacterium GW2011_GWF1_36_4]KKQ22598.1 MAG: Transcriptional regulator, TrmB [Candidatus Moranbacteria bacterium GW2011_GWF2_37_11]KKQ29001.1 MAG: Transcriptional regulator, TrmB [Candidatus Moranbacteria bacterium GW2011_GWD1_37_17]KKQ30463.1 MAG: Transcriptional regulator, TrmB [Candidatus Moranbacteria bacterium GW2011_GWE1_37_2
MNLKERLKQLDLGEKEIEVYISILKQKQTTITRIADSAGIKRTSVYHCLENLIKKGLISRISKDGRNYYNAEDPKESFSNILNEKKEIILSLIPKVKEIYGQSGSFPEIKIYHNLAGIKKIFEDLLSCKEKINRYYLSGFLLEGILGKEFVDDFVMKRVKKGIKSFSLRTFAYKPEREKGEIHSKQLREVRFIPENVIIKPYMVIYDDKVVVISTKEEKIGFVIQSKEYADAQKALFDMIWNNAAI